MEGSFPERGIPGIEAPAPCREDSPMDPPAWRPHWVSLVGLAWPEASGLLLDKTTNTTSKERRPHTETEAQQTPTRAAYACGHCCMWFRFAKPRLCNAWLSAGLYSSCRLLVTGRALLRGRWRRRQVGPELHRFVVTACAVTMKSLLIVQDQRICTAFHLDLRQRR